MRKLGLFVVGLSCLAAMIWTAAGDTPARLKGVVLYNRPIPALEPLAVTHNQAVCGTHVPNESLLVHKKGGLQNVFVFIANVMPESLLALDLTLEIRTCRFLPHVLAMGVGSQLLIRNSDAALQNVHALLQEFQPGWDKTSTLAIFQPRAETHFNFAFPRKNATAAQKMDKPGLLRLRSDAGYPWMSGYILVMPHRYFAVTDAEGKLELPELPPERYDLVLWHETLGVKRQLVEVKAGERKELVIKWFPEEAVSEVAASPDSTK